MLNPLLAQFVAEARDLLQSANEAVLALEQQPNDGAAIAALFRAVHTLKGNAGLFDFPRLIRVLHTLEDLLETARRGELPLSPTITDAILAALDAVGAVVTGVARSGTEPDLDLEPVVASLTEWARNQCPPASETVIGQDTLRADEHVGPLNIPESVRLAVFREAPDDQPLHWVTYQPPETAFFQGDDPFWIARHSPGLLWGTVHTPNERPLPDLFDPYRCVLRFEMLVAASPADLEDHFQYVRDQVRWTPLNRWALVMPSGIPDAGAVAGPFLVAAREALDRKDLSRLTQLSVERRTQLSEDSWQASVLRWIEAVANSPHPHEEVLANLLESFARGSVFIPTGSPRLDPDVPAGDDGISTAIARDGSPEMGPGPTSRPTAPGEAGQPYASPGWLRVDSVKVDRLVELVGELVVAHNALPYLIQRLEATPDTGRLARAFKSQYDLLHRLTEALQDAVLQLRMTPLATIFQRFPRLVRDLSRRLNKPVDFIVRGEETEIDRHTAEQLAEPLVHLLRNSLDHGIEPPAERRAAGKPERGRLTLTAHKVGDQIVIEVADDGRGIDPQRVRRRALERGLAEAEYLDRLSDHEVLDFIFRPGFSTAEAVTELSGRGVGMDVVRHRVEQVGGQVTLDSTVGAGTRVRLALPVTMVVQHVLAVEAGGQVFGIPLEWVVETVRIAPDRIRVIKRQPTVTLRGRLTPVTALTQALGQESTPLPNAAGEYAVLVVRQGPAQVGFMVDGFRGTMDVIVKPFPQWLSDVAVYDGTAVLGDGTVMLVINPKELMRCLSPSKTG